MAKVFLDANYIIGLVNRVPGTDATTLHKHEGFISALSCHILFYVNKINVPNKNINSYLEDFNTVDLKAKTLGKALEGPTNDLEDNIQLLTAAEMNCDYFLTADKKLLKIKFFGNVQIVNTLPN